MRREAGCQADLVDGAGGSLRNLSNGLPIVSDDPVIGAEPAPALRLNKKQAGQGGEGLSLFAASVLDLAVAPHGP